MSSSPKKHFSDNHDCEIDYYWRDYTGKIPKDALEAGHDINLQPTYIGQVFLNGHFLQVVHIYPGEQEVTVCHRGLHKTKTYVKILCTRSKHRFRWIPVDGKNLHVTTIDKYLVVGGTENGFLLNIGRINYQGVLIVGKVNAFSLGNAKMWFPYDNDEVGVLEYEILTYDIERTQVPKNIKVVE